MLKDAQRVTKSEEGVTMQQFYMVAHELVYGVELLLPVPVPNMEPHAAVCVPKVQTADPVDASPTSFEERNAVCRRCVTATLSGRSSSNMGRNAGMAKRVGR
jgi:hypothetical protein